MNIFSLIHKKLQSLFLLKNLSIGTFGLILLVVFSSACSNEKLGSPVSPPIPVTVGTVIQKAIPVQVRAIGNVQAYSTITVKSMVGGEIRQVHFTEGQDVKKGELLFTIDPRPFEAAVKQAEANLARDVAQVGQVEADLAKNVALVKQAEANLERDIAQAENAKVEAKRYESLIERQVVSRQQYDQFRTNAEALEATVRADKAAKESTEAAVRSSKAALENARAAVRADQAAVEYAKIQLGYCFIRSPIDGRTGNLLVKRGSVIKANDIDMLTINQTDPIYVGFSVPEQTLPEIKKYMAGGTLKVAALSPNDMSGGEQGVLSFIDNTVDKTTGTILLKGTFANKERRLWPGQFVNVVLTLTTQPDAIIIPSQAIQTGQQGQYVFVLKPDFTVEVRPVVVNRTLNNESIIDKGLQNGEKVVTDGQLQLVPGAKVEVKGSSSSSEKGL
jgi:multidrug efflux system membrane fusion protein